MSHATRPGRSRLLIPVLLLTCCCASLASTRPVAAEEEKPALPWHVAAETVKPLLAKGREKDLQAFVAQLTVDPWLLADTLAGQGDLETAKVLAGRLRGKPVEKLAAYLEGEISTEALAKQRSIVDAGTYAWLASETAAGLATLEPLVDGPDSVPMVWGLWTRARIHQSAGQPAEAVLMYRLAAKAAERIGWIALAYRARRIGGKLASALGDESRARGMLRVAAALAPGIASREEHAEVTINVGASYFGESRVEDAVRWFEKGERLTRDARVRKSATLIEYRFNCLAMLGNCRWHQGEFGLAQLAFAEGLALAGHLPERRGADIADTWHRLGQMQLALGLSDKALQSFREAERGFATFGRQDQVTVARSGAGSALIDLGRGTEAVAILEGVVAYMREDGAPAKFLIDELGTLALAYEAAGRGADAHAAYAEALALAGEHELADSVHWLELNRSRLYLDEQEFTLALRDLEPAVEHARGKGDDYRLRHALVLRARARFARKNHEGALADAREAIELANAAQRQLADADAALARWTVASVFHFGVFASLHLGDVHEATYFAESSRGMAFLKTLGARRHRELAAEVPATLRASVEESRAAMMSARADYGKARRRRDFRLLRKAREALEKARAVWEDATLQVERVSSAAAHVAFPVPATAEEIASVVRPDEALVFYGEYLGEQLYALVFEHGRDPRAVRLGDAEEVLASTTAVGLGSADVDAKADGEHVRRLQSRLVAPLGLADTAKTILVSPLYRLSYLPMCRLWPDRTVAYVPSGTTLVRMRQQAPPRGRGVLALGDPDYGAHRRRAATDGLTRGADLADLPGTREEVTRIASRPEDTALLGDKATEQAFRAAVAARGKQHARLASIHFACHGLVDEHTPRLSALALTPDPQDDGYLTAAEVTTLELPTDLVVLSACETAVGEVAQSEGVVGVMRSFMLAGTPRVIGSLWKVDDQATRALMIRFYELHRPAEGDGLPPAEALRAAQAHVRAQPKWSHPYYWAAWVLWGLPE